MTRFTRASRINVRVETGLRQAVEAVAADMKCSPSVAARHLLAEALAYRRAEAMDEKPGSAAKALGRIAACEIRRSNDYTIWGMSEDVRRILESMGIRKPKV